MVKRPFLNPSDWRVIALWLAAALALTLLALWAVVNGVPYPVEAQEVVETVHF